MSACKGSVFCVETVLGRTHGFAPTGARIVGYKWKCLLCADLLRIKNFALLFQTQNHNFMSRSPLQSTFDVRTRHYKFGAKRPFIPNSKFQIPNSKFKKRRLPCTEKPPIKSGYIFGGQSLIFSAMYALSSSILTRSCCMVSRSRTVTQPSSAESKS